jgi:hypothetical protein
VVQVRREIAGGRVVEDDGDPQVEPGGGGQPVTHLDGDERVEPEVLEDPVDVDALRRAVAEHRGDVHQHQFPQSGEPLGHRERAEAVEQ